MEGEYSRYALIKSKFAGFTCEVVNKSSNVVGIGYKEESKTLRVMFSSSVCYDYTRVPFEAYKKLQVANKEQGGSVGKAVRQWVQTIAKGVKVAACLED